MTSTWTDEDLAELKRRIDDLDTRVDTLDRRTEAQGLELGEHREALDTFVLTVWWKRWWFVVDGWSGHRVVAAHRWRPWHGRR